jgi:hypothetical protein
MTAELNSTPGLVSLIVFALGLHALSISRTSASTRRDKKGQVSWMRELKTRTIRGRGWAALLAPACASAGIAGLSGESG